MGLLLLATFAIFAGCEAGLRADDPVLRHLRVTDLRHLIGLRAPTAELFKWRIGLPLLVDIDPTRIDQVGRQREVEATRGSPRLPEAVRSSRRPL